MKAQQRSLFEPAPWAESCGRQLSSKTGKSMNALRSEKVREYYRRYRLRKKIARYGLAASTIDMRGRHGNHATGAANGRYGSTGGGPVTHGYSSHRVRSRTYNAWCAMKARCHNPKNERFHRYGGRGIRVCRRWLKFENFLADMGRAPSVNHWIGRIDNDGHYEPRNCRWETPDQQANQRSNNRRLTFRGQSRTLAEWARHVGLSYGALRSRINRGWPLPLALDPAARRVERARHPRWPKPKRALHCAECARGFLTAYVNGRFCSERCRKRYISRAYYHRHCDRINRRRRRRAKVRRRAAAR